MNSEKTNLSELEELVLSQENGECFLPISKSELEELVLPDNKNSFGFVPTGESAFEELVIKLAIARCRADYMTEKSIKLFNETNKIGETRNPFFPWRKVNAYWSTESKNCHSLTSSYLERYMGLKRTPDPQEMEENLEQLRQVEDFEDICLGAFYEDNNLTHTGFCIVIGDETYVISKYGNQNGIFISKVKNVRKYYGDDTRIYNIGFHIDEQRNIGRLYEQIKEELTGSLKKLDRLDNPIISKFMKYTFLDSCYD